MKNILIYGNVNTFTGVWIQFDQYICIEFERFIFAPLLSFFSVDESNFESELNSHWVEVSVVTFHSKPQNFCSAFISISKQEWGAHNSLEKTPKISKIKISINMFCFNYQCVMAKEEWRLHSGDSSRLYTYFMQIRCEFKNHGFDVEA